MADTEPKGPAAPTGTGENAAAPSRNAEAPTTTNIQAVENSTAIHTVNIISLSRQLADLSSQNGSARPDWKDLSTHVNPELTASVDVDLRDLPAATKTFVERGALIVDCVNSDIQWAAAGKIVSECLGNVPMRKVSILGDPATIQPGADQSSEGFEGRTWTHTDLTHPKLGGGGSCVLFVDLEGVLGQCLLDRVYRTKGTLDEFSEKLHSLSRYVIFLPRGRARTVLGEGNSRRGFDLSPLRVDFLLPWLRLNFKDHVSECHDAIRRLAHSDEWDDEALYEWLCGLEKSGSGRALLDRLSGARNHDALIVSIHEALDRVDGAAEPFLAVLFVASHLPGLGEADFCRVVEGLLRGRTRKKAVTVVESSSDAGSIKVDVDVELASEWRAGVRAVLRQADLEVRSGSGGARTICFRSLEAGSKVQSTLDESPMFVAEQLEHLLAAGFLFDRKEPIQRATVEFAAAVIEAEPDRYDSNWLFHQLRPVLAPDDMIFREAHRAQLTGALCLLRALQDAHARRINAHDSSARPPPSIVDVTFDRALCLDEEAAALFVPSLAVGLRDAPSFDHFYWLRQVVERGKADARERALAYLKWIPLLDEVAARDFESLLHWLDASKPGSHALAAAASTLSDWIDASIRFAQGRFDAHAVGVADFFKELMASPAAATSRLVSALLHPTVLDELQSDDDPLFDPYRLLLPPEAWRTDISTWVERWLKRTAPAWDAAIDRLIEDRVPDGRRYLAPAVALAAWCMSLDCGPAAIQELARAVPTRDRAVRTAIVSWLGVLHEALLHSVSSIMELEPLPQKTRVELYRIAKARKQAFDMLRTSLVQGSRSPEVLA